MATCQFLLTCCNSSSSNKSIQNRLPASSLWLASFDNQLAPIDNLQLTCRQQAVANHACVRIPISACCNKSVAKCLQSDFLQLAHFCLCSLNHHSTYSRKDSSSAGGVRTLLKKRSKCRVKVSGISQMQSAKTVNT